MKLQWKTRVYGEARYLFFKLKENMGNYGRDVMGEYITGPYRRQDNIQKITGPVAAAVSAVTELPDQLLAGLANNELLPPQGPLGRIRRDTGQLVRDVFTLHPIRAVTDVLRLPGSVVMDGIDMTGGHHQSLHS